MFKKRTLKNKSRQQRRTAAADDDSGGESDNHDKDANTADSLSQQIQQNRKKRKLLTDLQYKRGLDTNQLLQQPASSNNAQQQDEQETVNMNPLVLPGAASDSKAETSQEGILERKHAQAMESFVLGKLQQQQQNSTAGANDNAIDATTASVSNNKNKIPNKLTEEQLYKELAQQSAELAGKTHAHYVPEADGDMGAGGALASGTGISEVVLPVDERLQAARETAQATAASAASGHTAMNMRQQQSAVPSRFRVQTMQKFPGTQAAENAKKATAAAAADAALLSLESQVDDDRVGFAGTRQSTSSSVHAATGSGQHPAGYNGGSGGQQRQQHSSKSTDDRVYKKFMTRQREQRGKK